NADSTDQHARFRACGWHTIAVDGHDQSAVEAALLEAKASDKPTMIAARTTIGFGAPKKAGTEKVHGSPLGAEELAGAKQALGITYPAFQVPNEIISTWREAGARSRKVREDWEARVAAADPALRAEFERRMSGTLPDGYAAACDAFKRKLADEKPKVASRKASQNALEVINGAVPETIGGSADLTGSNLTRWEGAKPLSAADPSGRYVFYGVREFGMSAMVNGIALHGGLLPFAGTFLVFSDYARNALRMSALMGIRAVWVFTHDSIGLGEDGPTHQPVEHAAGLRQIPNMSVWRPCDAVETAVAWRAALERGDGPSSLLFSRQSLPHQTRTPPAIASIARGGYSLVDCEGEPQVILIATGSEVGLAVEAATTLSAEGVRVRVVSMPSTDVDDAQTPDYREQVLPSAVRARVAVEAGLAEYWRKYVGLDGLCIGLDGFGESAPYEQVYQHFGITAEAVADAARKLLRGG
ncbi:MAG: transketolase, partial [Gammaproteobacteria bacterium]|nr:transketolase [Gammaproteobacteria bacterium]